MRQSVRKQDQSIWLSAVGALAVVALVCAVAFEDPAAATGKTAAVASQASSVVVSSAGPPWG